jgi:hypothetical protein
MAAGFMFACRDTSFAAQPVIFTYLDDLLNP